MSWEVRGNAYLGWYCSNNKANNGEIRHWPNTPTLTDPGDVLATEGQAQMFCDMFNNGVDPGEV